MNTTTRLALAALAGLVGLAGAELRTADDLVVRATIPFEFMAGNRKLPAGVYDLVASDGLPPLLTITEIGHRTKAAVAAQRIQFGWRQDQALLVFNKLDDRYFLATVWIPGQLSGYQLLQGKLERGLGNQPSDAEVVFIEASGDRHH